MVRCVPLLWTVAFGTGVVACSRTPSVTSHVESGAPTPLSTETRGNVDRESDVGFWSSTAIIDRVREFSVKPQGLETDLTLGSGREEWRLLVTCRDGQHPCVPFAMVTLELQFDQVVSPDVWFSLRHAPRGYEPGSGAFRVASPSDGCFEKNFAEPGTHCTLLVHNGWTCDELARRGGQVNLDEGADEGRARSFVARIENRGVPIAVHVRVRSLAHRE